MRKGTAVAILVGAAATVALLAARCGASDATSAATTQRSLDNSSDGSAPRPAASARPRREPAATTGATQDGDASAADGGRVVFFSPWGGKLGEVGRDIPQEGSPSGPMSVVADGRGGMHVLDQVNGRMVKHGPNGEPERETKVPLTAQDLAVAEDGSVAVLDRFGDGDVALFDPNGVELGRLPLEGEGLEDRGEVTGVFVDGKDVYAEKAHGPLVKLGSMDGVPAEPRTEISGRPSRDGLSLLRAGIIVAEEGRAYVTSTERATGEHRFTRELRLKGAIHSIDLLDSDKSGTIYFAASIVIGAAPTDVIVSLHCLDPLKGVPIGGAVLPANLLPDESFRDLTVLDGGGVIYAHRTEAGVTYERYDCE